MVETATEEILALYEGGSRIGPEGLFGDGTDVFLDQFTLSVDQECCRRVVQAPPRRIGVGDENRIVDLVFGDELLHQAEIFIQRDAGDLKPFLLVFPPERDQIRHFGPARDAPGGPEVQDHDLASQIRQRPHLTVDRCHSNVRHLRALAVGI